MDIFPAIDLKNGACVRLAQGDFEAVTLYEKDPVLQASTFAEAGARWLHLVDLDGARDGTARQTELIKRIVGQTSLLVQTGGGIRSRSDIDLLLSAGVARVVIGSLAVEEPELVQSWIKELGGDKIVLAIDVQLGANDAPEILTRGWQDKSGVLLGQLLDGYETSGLKTILCTDVARDGMLTGPNLDLYSYIQTHFPWLDALASGGVASLDDILALREMKIAGVITGKALYENRFDLQTALSLAKEGTNAC